jgi:hypothetical protein
MRVGRTLSGQSRAVLGLLAALGALALPVASARGDSNEPTRRLAGNVWSVDAEKQQFILIDAGKQHVVHYSDATVVKAGPSPKAVTDLHRGDRVVVMLDEGEEEHARLIAIAGPPSATGLMFGGKKSHGGSTGGVHPFAPPAPTGIPQ